MVSVAERLRGLGSTDQITLTDVGGEDALYAALATLDEALLSRAADVVHFGWKTLDRPAEMLLAVADRLADVTAEGEFADTAGLMVSCALTHSAAPARRSFNRRLLDVATRDTTAGMSADALVLAAEVAAHAGGQILVDTLSALEVDRPADEQTASRLARAFGLLLDCRDESWLREVLDHKVLQPTGDPDAAVELAACFLRDAFTSDAPTHDVLSHLSQAVELLEQAADADEDRVDAVGLAAAAQTVAAFIARDIDAVARHVNTLKEAVDELLFYGRALGPARHASSAGAWLRLVERLNALERHAATHGKFEIRPAVESLLQAYGGYRSRILADGVVGLRSVLRPRVIELLQSDRDLAEGTEELAQANDEHAQAATAALADAGRYPKPQAPAPPLDTRLTPPARRKHVTSAAELFAQQLVAQAWDASSEEAEPLRSAFADLTAGLIEFVRRRLDSPKAYLKAGQDPSPKEDDLQEDLHSWLEYDSTLAGHARREPQKIAAGRVDIEYFQDGEALTIECKRELNDASRQALQTHYGGQASSYTATRHSLGVVAVLDLARSSGDPPPVYRECLWIDPAAQGGRTLLYVVVPGNRTSPSALSR